MPLSVSLPFFRSRSAERDADSDLDRFRMVRAGVQAAIDSAKREKNGLQGRLVGYFIQVSSLLDDAPDYAERSAEEEAAIVEAERNIAAVRHRLGQLEAQIAKLTGTLSQYDDTQDAAT